MTDDEDSFDRLPAAIDSLVREGMAAFDSDPSRAEFLFHYVLSQAPEELALYRVLYKFHNRRRHFEEAYTFASRGLTEAAHQAGLPADVMAWSLAQTRAAPAEPASHGLHALKALAFLRLRMQRPEQAQSYLDKLAELDPNDGVGGSVVRALLERVLA